MRTKRTWIPLLAVMLGLSMAAPTFAEPITCDPTSTGGCLQLGFFLNQDITQRITEVQVTNVESIISGTHTPLDPFAAPLLSQPDVAQSLAFAALGVPGSPSGLQTSTDDIVPDFVMSSDQLFISEDPNTLFVGAPEIAGPAIIQFALDQGLLTPNSPMVFPGQTFSDLIVVQGQLNIELIRDETIVDAFRLNITQDTNGGGPGPGPGGNPIPEPSTMLLLGSGLAGLALWRWSRTSTA